MFNRSLSILITRNLLMRARCPVAELKGSRYDGGAQSGDRLYAIKMKPPTRVFAGFPAPECRSSKCSARARRIRERRHRENRPL